MSAAHQNGPPGKGDRPPHHREAINVEQFPNTTNDTDPNAPDRHAWATLWRAVISPRLRSRLRWSGRERLALWLDRLCGEDTP